MIAKAIDKILEIARPIAIAVADEQYSTVPLTRIQKDLRAEPLEVATLTSLVRYIKDFNFKENFKETPLLVHVVSPTRVELTTALDGDRKRERLMIVHAELPTVLKLSYRPGTLPPRSAAYAASEGGFPQDHDLPAGLSGPVPSEGLPR